MSAAEFATGEVAMMRNWPVWYGRLQTSATTFSGRAVNPVSGTNWEGVGVRPDVEVPAGEALKVALTSAAR